MPEFEIELNVWQALEFGYSKLFAKKTPPPEGLVTLAAHRGRLQIVARALAGANVELHTAEGAGGRKGLAFLLPGTSGFYGSTEANLGYYLFRIAQMALVEPVAPGDGDAERMIREAAAGVRAAERAVAHWPALRPWLAAAIARERLSLATSPAAPEAKRWTGAALDLVHDAVFGEKPLAELAFSQAAAQVRERMGPPPRAYVATRLAGRLYAAEAEAGLTKSAPSKAEATFSDGRELEAPAREDVAVIDLDEEAWKKNAYAPQFEAVESLEEFNGAMRKLDGADELDEQQEAMRDLDLHEVVRTKERAHTIYRGDFMLDAAAPEAGDRIAEPAGIPYDEWDGRKKAYRKAWCTVYPGAVRDARPGYAKLVLHEHRVTYRALARRIEALAAEQRSRPRQTDGPEIDFDAVVDAQATLRAGHTPGDRLYVRTRREERDTALLVLMDLSLSTDGYTAGRRILDVARESLVVLGEAWKREAAWFSVAGFYSNTRHDCRFVQIKALDEPWERARDRLGALEPAGYTRIGPAVRHANATLARAAARRKALLLITDGKPNDYDRYEGRHGLADVRQAIREGGRLGVLTHALAIDSGGKDYLPAMLGHGNYEILPRPDKLAEALGDFFLRLRR